MARSGPERRRPARLPGPSGSLRIGLYGGAFDPPHAGHEQVIRTAIQRLALDWVWILPTASNPLKRTQTGFVERLGAAQRRLAGPRRRVTDLEAQLGVVSTVELIRALRARAPVARFVLIIGADNLLIFHRWRRWRELSGLVPIAVIDRPGAAPRAGLSRFARTMASARLSAGAGPALADRDAPAWSYLRAPLHPASSSSIRRMAARGEPGSAAPAFAASRVTEPMGSGGPRAG
jgi:nicotinate-nucleotide adenylyltransferase